MNQLKYDSEVTPEVLAQIQANSDRFLGDEEWDMIEAKAEQKLSLFWPCLGLALFLSYLGHELAPLNPWVFLYAYLAALGLMIYCGRDILKDWGWIKR